MGNIVGIDLGTTNSVAAFKFANTEVVTAPDNPAPITITFFGSDILGSIYFCVRGI
ncbi:MAG: hypothetical protein QNJ60_16195 [Xenococcaceae cyanobacterium MO_188.B19]|nr:hypothetical protein [Xenococcaceae cyanobacterium MO_188.B19]